MGMRHQRSSGRSRRRCAHTVERGKGGTVNEHDYWTDQAKVVRDLIRSEDSVLTTRMGWMGVLEGLLMTAFGAAWKDGPIVFLMLVAITGLFVALSTLNATTTAVATMGRLTAWWDGNRPSRYCGADVIGHRGAQWKIPWLRPSYLLPTAFALSWLLVLAYTEYRRLTIGAVF